MYTAIQLTFIHLFIFSFLFFFLFRLCSRNFQFTLYLALNYIIRNDQTICHSKFTVMSQSFEESLKCKVKLEFWQLICKFIQFYDPHCSFLTEEKDMERILFLFKIIFPYNSTVLQLHQFFVLKIFDL